MKGKLAVGIAVWIAFAFCLTAIPSEQNEELAAHILTGVPPELYNAGAFRSVTPRDGSLRREGGTFPPPGATTNYTTGDITVGSWTYTTGSFPSYTYQNRLWEGFVSFNTTSIPTDAVITDVTFKMKLHSLTKTMPLHVQEWYAQLYKSNYGTLDNGDWTDRSTNYGNFAWTETVTADIWYSISLPASAVDIGGYSEFQLRMNPELAGGGPGSGTFWNTMSWFSGESLGNEPQLIVNYTARNYTDSAPQTFYQNVNYARHLEANQTVDTWGVTSNATGVSISAYNSTVGAVSWHPTNWNAGRYYWINATFANPNGTSYYTYFVSVLNIKPIITSAPNTRATAGSTYVYNPTADEDAYGGVWTVARSNYPSAYTFTGGKLTVNDISGGSWWFNLTFDDMSRTSNATTTQNFTVNSVIPPYTGILEANFKYNLTGMTVKFTDLSKGPVAKWFWQFGDNTTSTLKDPTHAYLKAGKYKVKLTVMDSTGRSETTEKLVVVQGRHTGALGPYSFVAPMSLIVVCVAVTMTLKNRFVALGAMVAILGVIWFWVTGQFPTISISL